MTRILGGAVAVAALLAGACAAVEEPVDAPADRSASARPLNILWIVAEDLSPDLGVYGVPHASTPHLDRLAAEGARFTRAFATSPVCSAARSTIITGRYATSIGTHHHRSTAVPPADVRPFPERLRAAGYYTTNNAKTDYNLSPWLTSDRRRAVRDAPLGTWDESGAGAHWRHRPEGMPFFSVVNLGTTHEGQIRLDEASFAVTTASVPTDRRHDPAAVALPPYLPDTPVVRRDWARYHDLVTAMDAQVGEVLAELEVDGLADETVVFFYADHGRGLPRAKRWLYDSGLAVPLLVRWPGEIAPGTLREDLVSFLDLAPSVLAVAGVDPVAGHQGRVFLGRDAGPEPTQLYFTRDRMDETPDRIRAVRDRRYKYIRNHEPHRSYAQPIAYADQTPSMQEWRRLASEGALTGAQRLFFTDDRPGEELYDTETDPHEVNNLARDPAHGERLRQMRQALDTWTLETGDLGEIPEAELERRFRPDGRTRAAAAPRVTPAGGTFHGPPRVTIACPTEGAVAVYATEREGEPYWRLYTEPFRMGDWRLRARCGRLGLFDSPIVDLPFDVEFSWAVPESPVRTRPSEGGER